MAGLAARVYLKEHSLTDEQWDYLFGCFGSFVNEVELKVMADRAVATDFTAPELISINSKLRFTVAVEHLDGLLHDSERGHYREIIDSLDFPELRHDFIPDNTKSYLISRLSLLVFVAIISGKSDHAREAMGLGSFLSSEDSNDMIADFAELLRRFHDYIRSEENVPYSWWLNLNRVA